MNCGFRLIAAAVIASLAGVLGLSPVFVRGPAALETPFADTLSFCPDSTWKTEGEVFDVGVCVSAGIANLMGYNVAVTFDPSVIEVLNVVEGPLPKSAPPTFFQWLNPEGPDDSVHVNGALFGHTVDGPGQLFTLTFKGLHNGGVKTTAICITYSALRDGQNHDIDHERKCGFVEIGTTTGVESPELRGCSLEGYPNPFNPAVTIVLWLREGADESVRTAVSMGIYTPDGRTVRTLFNGDVKPGESRFVWDGKNAAGNDAPSGVYFAAAKTGAGTIRTKLVLIR